MKFAPSWNNTINNTRFVIGTKFRSTVVNSCSNSCRKSTSINCPNSLAATIIRPIGVRWLPKLSCRRLSGLQEFKGGDDYEAATAAGSTALNRGEVAMVLTAGGQGSRLGFDHPKGMFPIGPMSNRTLYQMLMEHLLARANQFDTEIRCTS